MNKNLRMLSTGLLAAAMVLAPALGLAQEKPKAPPGSNAEEKPAPAARPIPFRGTVAAVNKGAKTVTVGERVFHISSETKVVKNDQPATLDDVSVGDVIAGNYLKGDDGKLTAKMVRFGPKPETAERPPKKEAPGQKKQAAQPE
jgi:hypothetical protein